MKKVLQLVLSFLIAIPLGLIAVVMFITSALCMVVIRAICAVASWMDHIINGLDKEEEGEEDEGLCEVMYEIYDQFNEMIFDS